MAQNKKVTFTAAIQQHQGINAAYVEFPFNVEELYGKKGQVKIKAVFDKTVSYRGSLAKMGSPCHWIGLTQEVRKQLGKTFGDTVYVEVEHDTEVREVLIPDDAAKLLAKNLEAKAFYDKLSYTDRKEYMVWIESAKKEETRAKRLSLLIEKLNDKKKLNDK